jgi:histidyl-tRNA synthetase
LTSSARGCAPAADGAGRKDESGDFTKGAGLEEDQRISSKLILSFTGNAERQAIRTVWAIVWKPTERNRAACRGVANLRLIADLVSAAGYGPDRIRIDPSVVRGLEYYTGPVFEAELTFEVKGEDGKPIRFGSVGGGGRYDGLVSRFLPEPVPATGFSIGVSRLLSALKAIKSPIVEAGARPGPVVVLAMDKDPAALAGYQAIVADLRRAGIPAEMYLGSAGMKAQMKYADRRGSVCVVIQGSNERAEGEVQIKDLVLGATLNQPSPTAANISPQAEAQFTVKVEELVEGVNRVLARHRG